MVLADFLLLDIQRVFGKDNAGIIGVEMVPGEEGHAARNSRVRRFRQYSVHDR
ncbi:TPA: hypothetical protein QHS11_002810 [Enterobacter asburiae]|jgi:hypothetical protein|nr:hypothetical protein [Enterobacter asburiae]QPS70147.1 hypothetical protein I6G49_04945 [Enterobacter asburiae]HDR2774035.1 hypothetical protein [Enterobacter asburiae]HDS5465036.1 hypothetical protein [Enterobacter asburiae]HDS6855995.1 hypothetical protein [Enterobacter asburiae]